uniref:uncharacterized protein LOC127071804 isoform X1 n=1 Tax=Vespula vulgaris TaxID=7454 RepID=UPI00214452AF|nr:uncharacterized protein LOC127071804 isoform X1 [Vespula vulgaris]
MVFDRMKHEKTKKYSSVIFTLLIFWTFLLSYYWWYLSSENIDFSIQVNQLNEQLKMSIEERNQCVTLRMKLEERYKQIEDDIAYLHIKLEKQNNIQKKNDELKNSMTICKSKLHSLSILNAKLKENERFQKELEKVKDELVKLKLAYNAPANNIKSNPTLAPTRKVIDASQLHLVRDSAISISVAGQRGLKYHQIPILPTDPPGAVRLVPRLSVTMLKGSGTFLKIQGKKETAMKI